MSANDFRAERFEGYLGNPNAVGAFFYDLRLDGYIIAVGEVKASHNAARGRKITEWKWTDKAWRTLK